MPHPNPGTASVTTNRHRQTYLRLALAFAALAPLTAMAASQQDTTEALAKYFTQCHAVRVCNGSFLVAQQDKVLYEGALGTASARDGDTLTSAHAFDIGSISKQFTAAAIVRLVEHGKFRLDDAAIAQVRRMRELRPDSKRAQEKLDSLQAQP